MGATPGATRADNIGSRRTNANQPSRPGQAAGPMRTHPDASWVPTDQKVWGFATDPDKAGPLTVLPRGRELRARVRYGVIAMATGRSPTWIAPPAVLVAMLIGVTVDAGALPDPSSVM